MNRMLNWFRLRKLESDLDRSTLKACVKTIKASKPDFKMLSFEVTVADVDDVQSRQYVLTVEVCQLQLDDLAEREHCGAFVCQLQEPARRDLVGDVERANRCDERGAEPIVVTRSVKHETDDFRIVKGRPLAKQLYQFLCTLDAAHCGDSPLVM